MSTTDDDGPDNPDHVEPDGPLEIVVDEIGPVWRWVIRENGVEIHEGAALSRRTAQRTAEMVQRLMRPT